MIYAYDQPDMPNTYEISELTLSGTDYAPSTQTGHAWVVKAGTSTATCEQAGQETYECSICHLTKQETAQATGHKLTGTPAVAAFNWWNIFWWLRPHFRG